MRVLLVSLLLTACSGQDIVQDRGCTNIVRESTVGVPYTWAVMDEEVNTKMTDGCTFTTITHYVLYDDTAGSSYGAGSLPFGYYERQCQWDACGGPLPDKPGIRLSNPEPMER